MKGVNKMAKFQITALYEYSAEIEADSPEQAEEFFLQDLNDHYSSTESFDIEEIEEEDEEEEEED